MTHSRALYFIGAIFLSFLATQFLLFLIPLYIYQESASVGALGLLLSLEWTPAIIAYAFSGHLVNRFSPIIVNRLCHLLRCLFCIVTFILLRVVDGGVFALLTTLAALCAFLMGLVKVSADAVISSSFKDEHHTLAKFQSFLQSAELASMILGATLAGVSVALISKDQLLVVAGTVFLVAFLITLFTRPAPFLSQKQTRSFIKTLANSLQHIFFHNRSLRYIAIMNFTINLMAGVILGLNPAMVVTEFSLGESFYGYLNTAGGFASIFSLSLIPWAVARFDLKLIGFWACIGSLGAGVLMALAPGFTIYAALYLMFWCGISFYNTFNRTERIKHISPDMLGNIMGAFYFASALSMPVGGLVIYLASEFINMRSLMFAVSLFALVVNLALFYAYIQRQGDKAAAAGSAIPSPEPAVTSE